MIITSGIADWQRLLTLPLPARVQPAPRHFIDYFTLVNALTDIPSQLSTVSMPDDVLADTQAAITELPRLVQQPLLAKLLGIYFVRGLGSTGITEVVTTQEGALLGSVVLLDLDHLQYRTANAWADWKDNMPFAPDDGITLTTKIAHHPDDNRQNAIQHLLLHEFGHVLSAGEGWVPDWWRESKEFQPTAVYDFLRLCWQINAAHEIVLAEPHAIPCWDQLRYYGEARLPAEQMISAYQALQTSQFASLYATTSVYDDLAESFAIYVHTALLNKPFDTEVLHHGRRVIYYDAAARQRQCADKFRYFDNYLRSNP